MRSINLNIPILIPELFYQLGVFIVLNYHRLRYGYLFRRIKLSQGKYAIVDPEDYEPLNKHKWHLMKFKNTQYAVRIENGFAIIHMHRQIMNPPKKMIVHHMNHDGLDNRRTNLRIVTYKQNAVNNKPAGKCTSKYKGVHWHKAKKKWQVALRHNRKKIYIGLFEDEHEAAKAYDTAAKKYHGEYAYLNFPD